MAAFLCSFERGVDFTGVAVDFTSRGMNFIRVGVARKSLLYSPYGNAVVAVCDFFMDTAQCCKDLWVYANKLYIAGNISWKIFQYNKFIIYTPTNTK